MLEKGARPEWPDLAVLLAAPALGRVRRIGPAQAYIVVGPCRQGRRHWPTLLLFLSASGVGRITVVDHDNVEVSNLHWQVIHTEGRRGISKILV